MGFEKLQERLRKFFIAEAPIVDAHQKLRIREQCLLSFQQQKRPSLFRSFYFGWARSAVIGAILLSLFPFFGERSAGDLLPEGLVEVVRDGEIFVATGKTPLRVGDQILVGNNASAEIQLRQSLHAVAGDRAEIRVPRKDALFLVKGSLDGDLKTGSIETDRGKINSESTTATTLNVFVSESGETHILPRKNDLWVSTWDKGQTTLSEGEILRLQTDTELPPDFPENLRLSSSQILAIQSKLLIARTRALNAIDALIQQDKAKVADELNGADTTFKSMAQVLKSSRNLEVIRRENLELLSRNDVIARLETRAESPSFLLENAKAVDTLITLVSSIEDVERFVMEGTSLIFNRYALLQRLFAPLSSEFRDQGQLLEQQYVRALAQQIMNATDPIAEIDNVVTQLPRTGTARLFLQQLQKHLLNIEAAHIESYIKTW